MERCDDDEGDDYGDRRGHCVREAAESGLEEPGQQRLTQETDADRAESDPDLAGGDVLRQAVDLLESLSRSALTVPGHDLEPGAT